MTPAPSRRYLALFFPLLSADRWRREHGGCEKPLAFIEKQRGAMRIVAVNEQALALGIGPGLALADARARVPDLVAVAHDPAADTALLENIADDCERYTPSVALDAPNGLILDITGCAHIWGSEPGLAWEAAARLTRHGACVKLALAETPDRANALARHQPLLSLRRGETPMEMQKSRPHYDAPLPIAALNVDGDVHTALRRAGLITIDDLASRPRKPLAARFGMGFVTQLARVLGEEDARITPRRAVPAIFALRRFPEPIARTDYVLETIAGLVREAGERLRERGQGGRSFAIHLFRSDGDVRHLEIETGAPTRDASLLLRLFRERIDALADPLDPGFGYDAVRLDVVRTEAMLPAQIDGDETLAEDSRELIDSLGVRLGQRRVRRFLSGNSYIPELAGLTTKAAAPPLAFYWPETQQGEPPLRPLHLFDPPHPIEVTAKVPDGPPKSFRWRKRTHRVRLAEGPERIAAEWWRRKRGYEAGEGGLTRDYFRVEDESGRRFWLFRHGLYGIEKPHPAWYLHGLFA